MSEYEGSDIEDEQSEDGELTKSPQLSKDDQAFRYEIKFNIIIVSITSINTGISIVRHVL